MVAEMFLIMTYSCYDKIFNVYTGKFCINYFID